MNNNKEAPPGERLASLAESVFVISLLVASIATAVTMFRDYPTGGPIQLALTFTAFIGILMGLKNGVLAHWFSVLWEM